MQDTYTSEAFFDEGRYQKILTLSRTLEQAVKYARRYEMTDVLLRIDGLAGIEDRQILLHEFNAILNEINESKNG